MSCCHGGGEGGQDSDGWWQCGSFWLLFLILLLLLLMLSRSSLWSISAPGKHASCQVFCTWRMDVWKYHLRRDLLFRTILLCSLVQWEEENCRIISKSHGSRLPPGGYRGERPWTGGYSEIKHKNMKTVETKWHQPVQKELQKQKHSDSDPFIAHQTSGLDLSLWT